MTTTIQFQLETSGRAATLYLAEALQFGHLGILTDACAALPAQVQTLRIDLYGSARLGMETMAAVRMLMRLWRSSRGGECHLSFSTPNLVVRYSEREPVPAAHRSAWSAPSENDARTAAYL